MKYRFADTLKKLRNERGLSQQQLADLLFVDRSSIANWENGRRSPDAITLSKLADVLNIDISVFIDTIQEVDAPNVIIVDDEEILIRGAKPVLEKAMPKAVIKDFTRFSEALSYAAITNVAIAFLDIELGSKSGLDLCDRLIELNPHTNVIFLTSYADYAADAWNTKASGFLVKPVKLEDIEDALTKLRHPIRGLK